MITITTYLRLFDGSFQLAETCTDSPADPEYIEGAIELVIGGVESIGRRQWDYVDQLWAYISTMSKRLRVESQVDTYFPDQPILLAFQRKRNRILVSSNIGDEVRTANVGYEELISALKEAGTAFFGHMAGLVPTNAKAYGIALAELTG